MGCPHALHSDIYSFGLVLWEIISTEVPFGEITNPDTVRSAVCGLTSRRPHLSCRSSTARGLCCLLISQTRGI
jgi:hypothetical protein